MRDKADPPPPGFSTSSTSAATPLVLASPHSGRAYPAGFLGASRLTHAQLRRSEDAYVDELLAPAAARGVPLVAAHYGRAWLDLNRDPDELDPAMFGEPLPPHAAQRGERVTAGLGVVPRLAANGLHIYTGKLALAEVRTRIARVHTPYHAMLARLLDGARDRHGYAVLIDCHSMPTPPPVDGRMPPQIVIGDLHGSSAAPALVAHVEQWFAAAGYRTARNAPYAGGFTTQRHGRPAAACHALQIEIDRTLYMDPTRLTRHAGFAAIAAALTGLVESLIEAVPQLGLGRWREAAE
jgi:N-formylglutamate deformylase